MSRYKSGTNFVNKPNRSARRNQKRPALKRNVDRNMRRKERIIATKAWIYNQTKQLKCVHCGEDSFIALEFHRSHPVEWTVAEAVYEKAKSLKWIKNRFKKDTVLCANCHRKVDYNEKWGITPNES